MPLLDKRTVQQDPLRFVSESRAARRSEQFVTSGSTTLPLSVHHDRASLLANIGWSERERAVEAHFAGSALRYRALEIGHRKTTGRQVQDFYARSTLRPVRPHRDWLPIEAPLEEVDAVLDRVRPEVLRSYGTYIETLFRAADARGIRLYRPRVIVYAGDAMTAEGKTMIEERFGIPVISHYNAVEAFKIAYTCEERGPFHLHEDLCHVRLLEDGEVVISNLVNRGSVLLNYRLGDLASPASRPCSCGRTSALVGAIEGRVSSIIYLADGSFVHPLAVWSCVKSTPGILRYRLVQHERELFELKLETVDVATFDQAGRTLAADLEQLLRGARVEPTRADELERDPSGKFAPVIPLPEPRRAEHVR